MSDKPVELSPTQQLLLLRETTKTYGALHEAQALQIRCWPFAVDPKLINAVAKVDIEGQFIHWEWESKSKTIPKKRLIELQRAVRMMLGEEWNLKLKLNKKPIWP